jgi:nicotinamidase-related amidase
MLETFSSVLLVIDVQDKLFRVMHQRERLADNLGRLIRGTQVFKIPVIVTEQYPQGLGQTIPEISALLADVTPLPKLQFSCYREPSFARAIDGLGRRQVIITGIESHICVYQTAVDLIAAGYEVHVVADGVSSRTPENCAIGLDLMRQQGAAVTSVETVLFELLGIGSGDDFKAIRKIIL